MQKALGPEAIGIRGLSLEESIALASDSGFDSLVFNIREAANLVDTHGIERVREMFASRCIRPASWNAPSYRAPDEEYDAELAALPALVDVARQLGCSRATSFIMPGSDERELHDNMIWTVARLRPIAEILAAAGCQFGLEFCGPATFRADFRYPFVYTVAGVQEIAAAVGTGNVGVLLDAFHLYTSGDELTALDSLTAREVVVVHVNDAISGVPAAEQLDRVRDLPLAQGVLDLVGFMTRLQNMGYDGPVMVEPFSAALEARAAVDALAAARETAHSLEALWSAAGLN